jgi:ribose transport system substrate-binding protein
VNYKISFLLLASCLSIAVSCNSSSSSKNASGTSNDRGAVVDGSKTIGLSLLTTTNPFFNVIAENVKSEAAKHGYQVDVQSGEFDVARQRNQVKDFIVKGMSAIILCPCDSRAIGTAIQEANEAGIPVFTADIACLAPEAKVVSHIATDNLGGGRQAALGMIQALGEGGGKVAILDFKQAESCLLRVQGFKEVIEEHNRSNPSGQIDIVAELPGDGKRDIGFKATEDILQSHSDLAGVFAINDPSALGARAALEKAGRADQVKIIGFDGQPDGKQAIKRGEIYADPIQFPDRIGQMTVQTIIKYFDGEEVAPTQLIETALYLQEDAAQDPELD